MKILITGAAGFIGSHAVEHVLATTDHEVIALDGLTYAGDVRNYTESEHYDPNRVTHLYHDLRAPIPDHLGDALDDASIVWHFASDSHVDQSLERPRDFFLGNCAVTANLLEWARHASLRQFVQVSTDEVYGPTPNKDDLHEEWSTILPSNPYSASKAAQEALSIAYWRSYGVPLVITNTMNNFGERQHSEKYIPKVVRLIADGRIVPVHGTEEMGVWTPGSRCWLHARNHADALMFLASFPPMSYGEPWLTGVGRPSRYNISGEWASNFNIARIIGEIMGVEPRIEYIDAHSQRPGHDLHYGLDGSKLESLGWEPPVEFEGALKKTVDWYVERL